MAHSLETRMPFLDKSVVNFAMRLPSDMKIKRHDGRGSWREFPSRPKSGLSRYLDGVLWRELWSLSGLPLRHGLADFKKVDARQTLGCGREKYVLSPLAKRLPSELANRRKRGLSYPVNRFCDEPFSSFARELLLDGAASGGPLNRQYLESRLPAWFDRRNHNTGKPLRLVFLQSWWNEFFTNS